MKTFLLISLVSWMHSIVWVDCEKILLEWLGYASRTAVQNLDLWSVFESMSVMIYWSEVLDVVLWIVHPSSSNLVYRLQRPPYVQRVNSRKWNEIIAELGKRERNIHVSRKLMIRSWCPSRDLVLTNSPAGGTLRIWCWFSRQRLHTRPTDQCNFHGSAQLLFKVINL
jgi:hypothetical protein